MATGPATGSSESCIRTFLTELTDGDSDRADVLLENCKKEKVFSVSILQQVSEDNLKKMDFAIGEITCLKHKSKASLGWNISKSIEEIKATYFKGGHEGSLPKKSKKANKDLDHEMTVRFGLKTKLKGKKRKQVKEKTGGGIHEVKVKKSESSFENILTLGKREYGLENENICEIEINGVDVTDFTDKEGKSCLFSKYLKDNKLYASRCFLYLITKDRGMDDSGIDNSEKDLNSQGVTCEKNQDISEFPLTDAVDSLCIIYKKLGPNDSSLTFHGKVSVIEALSCIDPDILSVPSHDVNPIDYGYSISKISKLSKTYLDWRGTETGDKIEYIFPSACKKDEIILHGPDEIHGYEICDYVLGVVVNILEEAPMVEWFRDGEKVYSGKGLFAIYIVLPGIYYAKIYHNGQSYASNGVCVCESLGVLKVGYVINMKYLCYNVRQEKEIKTPEPEESSLSPLCQELSASSPCQVPNIRSSEFEVGVEIGQGAFGTVYKGTWLGTEVAIKKLPLGKKGKTAQLNFVKKEIEMLSRLRHPNLIQIMAYCLEPSKAMIVLEYMEGCDLDEIIFPDDVPKMTVDTDGKVYITLQVAQALAYLHGQKPSVIHQDIKPSNVLVSKNLTAKICDLGVSRLRTMHTKASTSTIKCVEGTPIYMAPECILKESKGTTASDIWSFACTILELFTEHDIWDLDSSAMENDESEQQDMVILQSLVEKKEQPHALRHVPESMPPVILDLVQKCLSYHKDSRLSAVDIVQIVAHLHSKCLRCTKKCIQ